MNSVLRHAIWPALLTIVLFAPSLGGGFVYDDESMLVENPRVVHATFGSILANDYWGLDGTRSWAYIHYRPLAILSFATIYRFFGLSPFANHAAGILMNAITTACFYWMLLGLKQRQPVAMAATFLFAVHPLHVEPVAWMVGLAETQTAALMMASLACFAWRKRAASVMFAVLATFTKESAMILPALIFAIAYLHSVDVHSADLHSADLPGDDLPGDVPRKWLAAVKATVPYAVVSCVYLWARAFFLTAPPPHGLRAAFRKGLHDLPAVAAADVKSLFVPWPLSVQYELPGRAVMIAVLIGIIIFIAAIVRFPALRHDLLVSGAMIVLPLIIPIATSPLRSRWLHIQDRLGYIATAGACLLIASLLARLPGRALVLGCMLLVPMGALGTYLQLGVWENDETLWTHVLEVTPSSSDAAQNLAGALYMDRRFADARKVIMQGLRYHPDDKYLNEFLEGMNRGHAILRRGPPPT